MNDRELLERAAKAAGMEVFDGAQVPSRGFYYASPYPGLHRDGTPHNWNPLRDDGDALRLAVKLRLDLDFDDLNPLVEVYRKLPCDEARTFCEPATNEGVRRAIVEAAAALIPPGCKPT